MKKEELWEAAPEFREALRMQEEMEEALLLEGGGAEEDTAFRRQMEKYLRKRRKLIQKAGKRVSILDGDRSRFEWLLERVEQFLEWLIDLLY